jgi:hypothetical protein
MSMGIFPRILDVLKHIQFCSKFHVEIWAAKELN